MSLALSFDLGTAPCRSTTLRLSSQQAHPPSTRTSGRLEHISMLRITLLSDPANSMKVLVFSDSTLCGVSHPDRERTWICREIEFGSPRSAIHFCMHYKALFTTQIEKHIQGHLNGQNPESVKERITFVSMCNDIEWTKKGNTETCLHNAQDVAAFATLFKPRHWCFLELASVNTCWNRNSNEPQGI